PTSASAGTACVAAAHRGTRTETGSREVLPDMEERGWTPASRAALSAVAVAFGWGAGALFYAAWTALAYPGRSLSAGSAGAMLHATGYYAALGWLLFALPVAACANPKMRILYWPLCSLFGAGYGLLAFMVLIGWRGLWEFPVFPLYAAVIGFVAGLIYGI